ncbi:MAG: ribonuclease PH [Candidatus Eisenbacteria bacterium]|uniref:Ribonuclease PH n=1 Tax=Eiseniibacteriota bacterium TaxID=2212470 RepID=A0A948S0W3_UNCEI|nr:ribonuclease PH [Candidatus Eisenbacteria bacterium]MBU1951172.1 ribonuclease PH [Candidatus Eisenbacteria bacterium]MBU2691789.1 ribonuclease PH [Candidatus Eisenbacteria bacterium]
MPRSDGRSPHALRKISIETPFFRHAEGSAAIRMGNTWVACAASLETRLPFWMRGQRSGWVTAEYGLLPRSVPERAARNRVSGRNFEIQRLVGRSLRAITDLDLLGERQIIIDCDVFEADGGTRTASVTAAYVALHQVCRHLLEKGEIRKFPIKDQLAAISVGLINGEPVLDLDHAEDSAADVDFNVVMTGSGHFVEVQGTAEGRPYTRQELNKMLSLAASGIRKVLKAQARVLPWILSPEVKDGGE